MGDCKWAAKRALGEVKRAEEVRPEWWQTDPSARSVKRILKCTCGAGVTDILCPYHVARRLVQQMGLRHYRTTILLDEFPLISKRGDPKAFVSTSAMIKEAQRLVGIMKEVCHPVRGVCPRDVTGHFMRRSGAKDLTRIVPISRPFNGWLGTVLVLRGCMWKRRGLKRQETYCGWLTTWLWLKR